MKPFKAGIFLAFCILCCHASAQQLGNPPVIHHNVSICYYSDCANLPARVDLSNCQKLFVCGDSSNENKILDYDIIIVKANVATPYIEHISGANFTVTSKGQMAGLHKGDKIVFANVNIRDQTGRKFVSNGITLVVN